jgi:hypothetical protein
MQQGRLAGLCERNGKVLRFYFVRDRRDTRDGCQTVISFWLCRLCLKSRRERQRREI